jgi:hypothetical protein
MAAVRKKTWGESKRWPPGLPSACRRAAYFHG